jgi:hypothetical protein
MPKNSKAASNSRVVARQMEEAATYSPRIIGNSNDGVSWDLFKWVVGALMALIVTLVTLYLTGAKDDLTAVRKDFASDIAGARRDFGSEITEVRREISDTNLDFARSVADVEKQLGTTNGKLEMLSQRH